MNSGIFIEMKKILPITNVAPPIPAKDIWIIWLEDKNRKVTEFQIYDISTDDMPYEHSKKFRTFSCIDHRLPNIAYKDWGAISSSWKGIELADIFFQYAIKIGLRDKEVVEEFLNQLSLVAEWRKDILMYMNFIGMRPYYKYDLEY